MLHSTGHTACTESDWEEQRITPLNNWTSTISFNSVKFPAKMGCTHTHTRTHMYMHVITGKGGRRGETIEIMD